MLRHAGTSDTTVSIAFRPAGVELTVHDTGVSGHRQPTSGRGIAGMRERVASLGGTLDAGPDAGGGYSVRATLPLPAAPT